MLRPSLTLSLALLLATPAIAQAPTVSGVQREWQRIELTFTAPFASAETAVQNPFLDYRLNVRFTRPDGTQIVVPGFFAADGNAADTSAEGGNRWRVRLTPDRCGTWSWLASFRTGPGIAVATDFDTAGTPVAGSFHGQGGQLSVGPFDPQAPQHRLKGRLVRPPGHYLCYAGTHETFLKGGTNSPENLLGYYEFDNTYDLGGGSPPTADGLHHFDAHLGDFNALDPVDAAGQWQGTKGRRLLGAVDYLASQGADAVYFLTYNTDGGDGRDTWPWREPSGAGHKRVFDVSKLEQWERVLAHMDARGMLLHVVLQELENDQVMGGLTTERKLYHRELVARFAHHNGLLWNIGEENGSSPSEQIEFAEHLRALDPYDHPITVHNQIGQVYSTYPPLFGSAFDATSIQGSPPFFNALAKDLRKLSSLAGQPFVVFADEAFAPSVLPDLSNWRQMREQALWGNLMGGGGGVEWYFSFADTSLEDFRFAAPLWSDMRIALEFFRRYVHVDALVPDDEASVELDDHVLSERGETYVVYRPKGGGALLLVPEPVPYTIQWYDPRNGGVLQDGVLTTVTPQLNLNGSFVLHTGPPPSSRDEDWVILVRNAGNRPPVVTEFRTAPEPVSQSGPIVILVRVHDPDGPDDVLQVGMGYLSPFGELGTVFGTPRGGDLYTISRTSASFLPTGLWPTVGAVTDKAGAVAGLLGSFTVVP